APARSSRARPIACGATSSGGRSRSRGCSYARSRDSARAGSRSGRRSRQAGRRCSPPTADRGAAGQGARWFVPRRSGPARPVRPGVAGPPAAIAWLARRAPTFGAPARARARVAAGWGLAPWRRRRGPSGRPVLELAGRPQPTGAGAWVVGHLAGGRSDRALREELGLRGSPAGAHGEVRRADAAARPRGQEALHATVLERVERDRGE